MPDVSHTNLVLIEENLSLWTQQLATLPADSEVIVVACVGPVHSGKSFLLNQLAGCTDGFRLGPQVDPETRGIWVWKEPIQVESVTGRPRYMVLLDTEGFYARDVSESYDAKLFSTAMLMSSMLVYNSVKTIDQSAIEYLELLARRAQLFQLRTVLKYANLTESSLLSFPSLTWVVEDFFQEVPDASPTDWLLRLLHSQRRDSSAVVPLDPETSSGISDPIPIGVADIFHEIACHTLFLPATSKEALQRLHQQSMDALLPAFHEGVDHLRRWVINSRSKRDSAGERPIAPLELVSLLRLIVSGSNENLFPQMPSMWSSFLNLQSSAAVRDCVTLYRSTMHSGLRDPVSNVELSRLHAHSTEHATETYRKMVFGLPQVYEKGRHELLNKIDEVFPLMFNENEEKARSYLQRTVRTEIARFDAELSATELPVLSSLFELKVYEPLRSLALEAFRSKTSFLSDIKVYDQVVEQLERETQGIFYRELARNTVLIKTKLKESLDSSLSFYKSATQELLQKPIEDSLLQFKLAELWQATLQRCREMVGVFHEDPEFDVYVGKLERDTNKLADDTLRENKHRVNAHCKEISERVCREPLAQLARIGFPQTHIDAEEAAHLGESSALAEFSNVVSSLLKMPECRRQLDVISTRFDHLKTQVKERIVKDTKIHSNYALELALEELQDDVTHFFFDWTFRRHARRVAIKHLLKRLEKTPQLAEHVADDFVANDLHHLRSSLHSVSSLLVLFVVALLSVSIVVLVSVRSRSLAADDERKTVFFSYGATGLRPQQNRRR
eukprot:CAMPEP_0174249350 /NCGR_PEP_ID=MMETSP0417-20130205/43536_1 /TAXON_ID=242541 /ORGANISM="Mayorella sp, Strain BSH-02190019" /LENGTH=786 /DNA_ID=CAMNT_0015329219 /DNA_START=148 /DNA_END=2508 /DNA_ORIENTATION=+